MSSLPHRPSSLVHVSMPTEFTTLCRSLLVHDPVYGPLMSVLNHEPNEGLWAMRLSTVRMAIPPQAPADSPAPIEPKLVSEYRTHNS